MCLFTSALRASVNKSHIPSLPQNNLYLPATQTCFIAVNFSIHTGGGGGGQKSFYFYEGGGGHKKFAFSLEGGQKSFQSLFSPFTNPLSP